MSRLTPVSFDIETTGFDSDARVTVLGLRLPLGCRLFCNTDDRAVEASRLEATLEDRFEVTTSLSCHATEDELFEAFGEYVRRSVTPNDYMLVAYNGELYRGGFDLPFLRTRLARQNRPWPFVDVPYADLLPLFRNRFNTTAGEEAGADLPTVYKTLVGGDLVGQDPFEDSAEAVEAFERGEFEALLAHNVVDVLRTDALAGLAQRYCGKSDFKLKSLTATADDAELAARH